MNFKNIKKQDYCLNSTFPKVEKNERNEKVVKKLLDIYAGSKSELTAVCQYMYESFYIKPEHRDLSEILENISICEMRHVEVISQILLSMGVNPKFCRYIDSNQNICNYWSAGSVKYITDVNKFIEYNIKLEEYAIFDYKELLKLTNSENIKQIVYKIIQDEEAHLNVFNKIKDELKNNSTSRCSDVEDDIEIENISNNNDREIVSIFSPSPIKKQIESININNNNNNNIGNEKEDILSETIQIPVQDLNNFTEDEINYRNELEQKVYLPDDIIDG